jgi:hypothetical protein
MKKIISGIVVLVFGLLAPQIIEAQGTITYLSNLNQPSASSHAVGSDSWQASSFGTGTDASGYTLDSIQLGMKNASGNPSSFTVMLYSAIFNGANYSPGSSLESLNGSLNPATGGIYTYTPASNLTLSPSTAYFVVLTAGTVIANGAYEWSVGGNYNPSGGWQAPLAVGAVDIYQSSDGSNWSFIGGSPQFAINASAVPEPSSEILLGLGGVFLFGILARMKLRLIGTQGHPPATIKGFNPAQPVR